MPPFAILSPSFATVCLCNSVLLRQGKFSSMKLKNEDIAGKLKTFKGFSGPSKAPFTLAQWGKWLADLGRQHSRKLPQRTGRHN